MHTVVVDLGEVNELSRPVFIDRRHAFSYAEPVKRLHLQERAEEDDQPLIEDLLDALLEVPITRTDNENDRRRGSIHVSSSAWSDPGMGHVPGT
jgi:hypothetical protein